MPNHPRCMRMRIASAAHRLLMKQSPNNLWTVSLHRQLQERWEPMNRATVYAKQVWQQRRLMIPFNLEKQVLKR